jgi:glutaredoxin
MTKSFLQSKDLTYKEVDISTDQSGLEWVANATGQLGTPVTKIGDKIIIGFDRISLEEAIKEL